MAENWIIQQTIDLARPETSPVHWLNPLMVTGDQEAHTWEVKVTRHGAPVNLTGAVVTCYVIRPRRDSTVFITGKATGNTLSATFPRAAYAYPGNIMAVLKYMLPAQGTVTAALLYAQVRDNMSATVVDSENLISIEEMLALVVGMERLEETLETAEAGRAEAEGKRDSAEAARVTSETGRKTAETGRVTAESQRAAGEAGRVSAEESRVAKEQARMAAEAGRVAI